MENWKRVEVRELIDLYRFHECLWNIKTIQYKDRNLRDLAIKDIYDKLKHNIPDVSIGDIKKKINTLRSQYRKELKLKINSMNSGVEIADIYTPKLWCFDLLEFLEENTELRPPTSSLDAAFQVPTPIAPKTTEENVDLSFESDFPQVQPHMLFTSALNPHSPQPGPAPKSILPSSHSISRPKKKRRPSGSSEVDDLLTVVMQKLSDTDNKFTNFGKMVADELVNMKIENALLVKNLIAEALNIGSLGLITPEHFIALSKKDGGALKCDKEWMSTQENVKKRKRADFETPLHEPSLKISAVESEMSDSEFILPDIQAPITDSSVSSQSSNRASVSVVNLSSLQDQTEDSQFVQHTTRPPSIDTQQDKLQETSVVAQADPGGTPDEKTIQSQKDISVPPDKGRITEGSKIIDTTSIELLDKNDLTTEPSQSLLTSVEDLQKGQPDPIGTRATKTLISGWCLDDECSDFARIVAGKLRRMKDFERCITEKIICEALFLGSTGALSPSAHLVNE